MEAPKRRPTWKRVIGSTVKSFVHDRRAMTQLHQYAEREHEAPWTLGQVGVVLVLCVVAWLAVIGAITVLGWVGA